MEAYSLDLRQRICAACDEQEQTREEVADLFAVSRSFLQKLLRLRQSGSIAPKPRAGGFKPRLGQMDQRLLRNAVKSKPDSTLAELCAALVNAGGASVSEPTMCRTLKTLRLRLKKRRCTPRSGTRRGFARCVGTLRSASGRWRPESWFSWMKAASTPR